MNDFSANFKVALKGLQTHFSQNADDQLNFFIREQAVYEKP